MLRNSLRVSIELSQQNIFASPYRFNCQWMLINIRLKYNRARSEAKIARKFRSIQHKSWQQPTRKSKQEDVCIEKSQVKGHVHFEVAKNLQLVARKYKTDLLDILTSGAFGGNIAGIVVSKVRMSVDAKKLIVMWTPTGSVDLDRKLEEELLSFTPQIQECLNKLYTSKSPSLSFTMEPSKALFDKLMEDLDLDLEETHAESDLESEDTAYKPPPIKFVQDVYGLDRQVLLQKVMDSAGFSMTKFGAYDRTTTNLDDKYFTNGSGEDCTSSNDASADVYNEIDNVKDNSKS